jgi:quercetin dioxygenase-like cupin family protein
MNTPLDVRRGHWLRSALSVCAVAAVLTIWRPAHAEQPVIVMPDQITWRPVGSAGMMVAVVHGDPSVAGPYTMLIKIPAGMKIPPHSHPDRWRTSVVVSGTLYFGFGNAWDEAALKPFTPGTVWTEPPGANHFVWAKDGEVIAMLTAMGPTGFAPVAPAK